MQVSNGDKLHIGFFGRVNSGKSSLLNALCGQNTAIVSSVRGTTTDPVYKSMEINGLGAVRLIDTAGIDDDGELGALRNSATEKILNTVDIAVVVCGGKSQSSDKAHEKLLIEKLIEKNIPYIIVNNINLNSIDNNRIGYDFYSVKDDVINVNATNGDGIQLLIDKIKALNNDEDKSVLKKIVKSGDTVVLVMPQDNSAPKGRLILPQVKVIRELLDIGAHGVICVPDNLNTALKNLSKLPDLVITDSQAFGKVSSILPKEIRLTSFSVLLSAEKGDIRVFIDGADNMDKLNAKSKVLIAEACSHIPQNEDIGRVKIPAMLKNKYGVLNITHCNGNDFPDDLSKYDLIIHCGACMFNRRLVMSRVRQAISQNVPITNYGIAIAKLQGILDRVELPIIE